MKTVNLSDEIFDKRINVLNKNFCVYYSGVNMEETESMKEYMIHIYRIGYSNFGATQATVYIIFEDHPYTSLVDDVEGYVSATQLTENWYEASIFKSPMTEERLSEIFVSIELDYSGTERHVLYNHIETNHFVDADVNQMLFDKGFVFFDVLVKESDMINALKRVAGGWHLSGVIINEDSTYVSIPTSTPLSISSLKRVKIKDIQLAETHFASSLQLDELEYADEDETSPEYYLHLTYVAVVSKL
jgi:hypothetical protein